LARGSRLRRKFERTWSQRARRCWMKATALQNVMTRLIHEDKFRREFEADREKCLSGLCLSEGERFALASIDLERYLDALRSQQLAKGPSRAVKGGSTL